MCAKSKEQQCRICKEYKLIKEFQKDKQYKSGISTKCKVCNAKDAAKYRASLTPKQIKKKKAASKEYHKVWREKNRVSIRKKGRAYRKKHLEQCKEWAYKHCLKKYGMTLDDYYIMFAEQQGKCAICGKVWAVGMNRFHIDHNHKTGKVRGILCPYCNTRLLRFLWDNKVRATGLVRYLQKALDEDSSWK